jgi:hypothetical protein
MNLHLVDTSSALIAAWRIAFSSHHDVAIEHGDILVLARGALVSPANSNGFMDGGIDQQYAAFFGRDVQGRVLEAVRSRPEGHLPVGAAAVVPTDHAAIPYLIVAPTMFAPGPVPASHAYRALRAVLRLHGVHPARRKGDGGGLPRLGRASAPLTRSRPMWPDTDMRGTLNA